MERWENENIEMCLYVMGGDAELETPYKFLNEHLAFTGILPYTTWFLQPLVIFSIVLNKYNVHTWSYIFKRCSEIGLGRLSNKTEIQSGLQEGFP